MVMSDSHPSFFTRLILALRAFGRILGDAAFAAEVSRLERGVVVLEVIVGIAPLLGLVGTIHGLIVLFGDLGKMGLGESSVFARGIAIALNATLLGLLVAIPAVWMFNYFISRISRFSVEMNNSADELVDFFLQQQEAEEALRVS